MAGYFGAGLAGALQGENQALAAQPAQIQRILALQGEMQRQAILRKQLADQYASAGAVLNYYGQPQQGPAMPSGAPAPAPGQPSLPAQPQVQAQPTPAAPAAQLPPVTPAPQGVGPMGIMPYKSMQDIVAEVRSKNPGMSPQAVMSAVGQISKGEQLQNTEQLKLMQYKSNLELRLQGLEYQRARLDQTSKAQQNTQEWRESELEIRRATLETRKALVALGGKPPTAYKWTDDTKTRLEAIPGGPADVSPYTDAFKLAARQYLAGDRTAVQGFSRNAQMRAAMAKTIAEEAKAQGMNGKDVAATLAEFHGTLAGERTLGTRQANIDMAVTEAQNIAPTVLRASAAVDRTEYPSINRIILSAMKGTGDPNVVKLGIAMNTMINVYSRAISPTGVPTVSDKDHAREVLDAAWSKGQIQSGIQQLFVEMEAAKKSPISVRGEMRKNITGDSGTMLKFDAQGNLVK